MRRPPDPFDQAIATLPADHRLYRVLSATRTATDFNPGAGSRTRFGFFGDRCAKAFAQDPSHARIFASPADQLWLIDRCAPLLVDVLLEPS